MSESDPGAEMTPLPRVKILYILGDGRSGSTLLDLLLGSHPRVQSLGEIKQFHRYAGKDGKVKKCTCGETLLACPLWGRVLEELKHDYSLSLQQEENFALRNYDLFRSISRITDREWLCDSSKEPGRLDLLLNSPGIDVEIIHLVRDPRAVAYSNIRKRRRVRKAKGFSLWNWREYNYVKSIRLWKKHNLQYRDKYGGLPGYRMLRYENLVEDHASICNRLWESIGLDAHEIRLETLSENNHNIGGNHMRRQQVVEISRDDEFREAISAPVWFLSSCWLSSTLEAFGYSKAKRNA